MRITRAVDQAGRPPQSNLEPFPLCYNPFSELNVGNSSVDGYRGNVNTSGAAAAESLLDGRDGRLGSAINAPPIALPAPSILAPSVDINSME